MTIFQWEQDLNPKQTTGEMLQLCGILRSPKMDRKKISVLRIHDQRFELGRKEVVTWLPQVTTKSDASNENLPPKRGTTRDESV